MSSVEVFVVIFCAVMGYLIVAHFIEPKGKHPEAGRTDTVSSRSTGASSGQAEDSEKQVADAAWRSRPLTWWEVLGVSLAASEEEIQRAYRTQIGKYHPDKVAHLADELRQLAEHRTKEINGAYVEAMRMHGRAM